MGTKKSVTLLVKTQTTTVSVCVSVLQVDRLCGSALYGRPDPGLQLPRPAVRHLRLRQASYADDTRLPVKHRRQPAHGVCYQDNSQTLRLKLSENSTSITHTCVRRS